MLLYGVSTIQVLMTIKVIDVVIIIAGEFTQPELEYM